MNKKKLNAVYNLDVYTLLPLDVGNHGYNAILYNILKLNGLCFYVTMTT